MENQKEPEWSSRHLRFFGHIETWTIIKFLSSFNLLIHLSINTLLQKKAFLIIIFAIDCCKHSNIHNDNCNTITSFLTPRYRNPCLISAICNRKIYGVKKRESITCDVEHDLSSNMIYNCYVREVRLN